MPCGCTFFDTSVVIFIYMHELQKRRYDGRFDNKKQIFKQINQSSKRRSVRQPEDPLHVVKLHPRPFEPPDFETYRGTYEPNNDYKPRSNFDKEDNKQIRLDEEERNE